MMLINQFSQIPGWWWCIEGYAWSCSMQKLLGVAPVDQIQTYLEFAHCICSFFLEISSQFRASVNMKSVPVIALGRKTSHNSIFSSHAGCQHPYSGLQVEAANVSDMITFLSTLLHVNGLISNSASQPQLQSLFKRPLIALPSWIVVDLAWIRTCMEPSFDCRWFHQSSQGS